MGVKLSEATLGYYMWWAEVWSQTISANVSFSLPCSSPLWLFLRAFPCSLLWWEQITAHSKFLPSGFAPALQHASSLEMVFLLKRCYQLNLGSKRTSISAIRPYNWVLQTPNWCGWFADFLLLVCFPISFSCNTLPPWRSFSECLGSHRSWGSASISFNWCIVLP